MLEVNAWPVSSSRSDARALASWAGRSWADVRAGRCA